MGTTILPKYGTAKKTVLTPHDTDTHHTLFQFPLPAELSRRLGLVDTLRLCVGGQPLLFSLKARTPDLKILERSGGAEKLISSSSRRVIQASAANVDLPSRQLSSLHPDQCPARLLRREIRNTLVPPKASAAQLNIGRGRGSPGLLLFLPQSHQGAATVPLRERALWRHHCLEGGSRACPL